MRGDVGSHLPVQAGCEVHMEYPLERNLTTGAKQTTRDVSGSEYFPNVVNIRLTIITFVNQT